MRIPRSTLGESSGLGEAEVVERYTYTACTHCFPDAPVASQRKAEPGICTGTSATEKKYVNRYVGGGTFGRCTDCGAWGKVKQNGQPYKHKAPVTA